MADVPDYQRYLDDLNQYNWLMDEVLRHETIQAMHLGQYLAKRLRPSYVLDLGCGPGVYLLPFRHVGAQIYGVDGAGAAGSMLGPGEFEQADLRQPWRHERVRLGTQNLMPRRPFKFDLSLCIEVAEHLLESDAQTLVETIVANSRRCYFSAAYEMPGGFPQSGEGHFNLQPKSWWLHLFQQFGWGLDVSNDLAIHAQVNTDSEMAHCGWLRWNGMLLTQKENADA